VNRIEAGVVAVDVAAAAAECNRSTYADGDVDDNRVTGQEMVTVELCRSGSDR